jgi:hypothetical protein
MSLTQSLTRVALATAALLLIPLVAMRFDTGVNWNPSDFVVAGVMLSGAGCAFVLIARKWNNTAYRLGVGVAVAAGLLLMWANLAVGLVGSEDNPANLLYGGVLLVAGIGAAGAHFRPLGMSRAMFAAALTYALVTVIALFFWRPTGAVAEPAVGMMSVLGANAAFAALWVVAGWLFQRAGAVGSGSAPLSA